MTGYYCLELHPARFCFDRTYEYQLPAYLLVPQSHGPAEGDEKGHADAEADGRRLLLAPVPSEGRMGRRSRTLLHLLPLRYLGVMARAQLHLPSVTQPIRRNKV